MFPDGKLYDVMRYDMTKTTPNGGMAIIYRVDTEHPEEPLTFVRTMDFYANYAKFEILHDKETGRVSDDRFTFPGSFARALPQPFVSHVFLRYGHLARGVRHL